MSVRKYRVAARSGLALALLAAPVLHAQVTAPGTNPGTTPTSPPPTSTTPPTTTTPTPTASSTPGTGDQEMRNDLPFLREAAGANLLEVTLGRIASTRASNSAVKDFGQRMVSDHSSLQQQLTSVTSTNGVPVSAAMTSQQQQDVSRLQQLSGTAFDSAYIGLMVRDHQLDVAKFNEQSRTADSPRVRELASKALPTLRLHLSQAQKVASQINLQVATTGNDTTTQKGQGNAGRNSSQAAVRADRNFFHEATTDNYLEIQLGQLAERRAQNSAVKQYAQRLVADHTKQQNEWLSMASDNGQGFTPGMGKNHRKKLTNLEKLNGREFDRAFMTQMVQDHKDYIDYFEKEGRAAHSTQVRRLVERDLPTLRNHFNQAKQIGARVGADTSATLRSERQSANR
jgi:putative membrane protein